MSAVDDDLEEILTTIAALRSAVNSGEKMSARLDEQASFGTAAANRLKSRVADVRSVKNALVTARDNLVTALGDG